MALSDEQRDSLYRIFMGNKRFPKMGKSHEEVERIAFDGIVTLVEDRTRRDLIAEMRAALKQDNIPLIFSSGLKFDALADDVPISSIGAFIRSFDATEASDE